MMLDFRGGGGSKMSSKNWTLEYKNRLIVEGGGGGSKMTKTFEHYLWMFPCLSLQ